jgi:hypothetical protein
MHSFQDLEAAFERCFLKLTGAYSLQPEPTTEPALVDLGKRINIKFITADQLDCADLSYDVPSHAQLQRAIEPLVFELNLYPREALRRTRIEQIILCNDLMIGGKRAAGTLKVGLHHVDTLFIDLQAFREDQFGRHTIHHELFHAIDFRDTWEGLIDTDWHKLQGKNYSYELDSAVQFYVLKSQNPQEIERPRFDDPYDWLTAKPSSTPGFLTEYAKYSTVEDKAEVFSHMMASYNAVMKRASHDAVLNGKVQRVKELALHFCDELDHSFWQRISDCRKQPPDKF